MMNRVLDAYFRLPSPRVFSEVFIDPQTYDLLLAESNRFYPPESGVKFSVRGRLRVGLIDDLDIVRDALMPEGIAWFRNTLLGVDRIVKLIP